MVMMIQSKRDASPELCSTTDAMAAKMGQKRQRRVTFNEETRTRTTYSSDQVQGCWYNDSDYHSFKTDICQTVDLMKHNFCIDEVLYSQRGLEKYLKDAARSQHEVQEKAWFVVMKRQEVGQGKEDPMTLADSIAQFYTNETRLAKMAAYLTGIADERYARSPVAAVEEDLPKVEHPQAIRVDLPPRAPRRPTTISAAA
mmetsp:Transcript_119609/g.334989  ORF Transcript_119609/g.334989 Transcript_119609/m.334989 type:complete len:199 (-) Transcript_119609:141-737(-)